MSEKIIVLKFGGSVLQSEDDLSQAVHEIYRHWRRGTRVVAVVSALGQTTDDLIRRANRYGTDPNPAALASLLLTGEAMSAALLALALGRSGIPTKLLSAEQAGIQTKGDILDAEPVAADVGRIKKELENSVVVVSGFTGVNERGDLTLLGRGGSDYTALFLAQQLNARCVLIKDVEGLYESDPANSKRPRRFAQAGYATTLQCGAVLVQEKALRFAEKHDLHFEIAAFGSESGTTIGNFADAFAHELKRKPIRVALLGCGTVGGGVYQRLTELPELFEITGVVNLDPQKAVAGGINEQHIARDAKALIETGCDIVVELIGGIEPAKTYIEHALRLKRHVITANKALLATAGEDLRRLAESSGVTLRYSASVGGALPALEAVAQNAAGKTESVAGIINGTCNFICDQLASGVDFNAAVNLAQTEGFAEADPTLDLNGTDAAQKIILLARETFGVNLPLSSVHRTGIDSLNPADVSAAVRNGYAYRLIAECRRTTNGVSASVRPVAFPISHPFAQTRGAENCLVIKSEDGRSRLLRGRGAGRYATTEAVIADLFDLRRSTKTQKYKEAAA